MRKRKTFLVITFSETADAMAAERLFERLRIPGRIIPIPSQLSAGCGLSWRTEPEQEAAVRSALDKAGIRFQEMAPVNLWV